VDVLNRRRTPHARDERGLVIVLTGFTMVVLLCVAALAVDLGYDRQLTRHLQVGTDAGSLAGAQELPQGTSANLGKAAVARATAAEYAVGSLFDGTSPVLPTPNCSGFTCTYVLDTTTIRVTSPYTPVDGLPPHYGAHNFVHIQACQPGARWFSGIIGSGGSNRCREAVARSLNLFDGFARGLVALSPTSCRSIEFAGSSTTNLHSDGAVVVESSCIPNALDGGGSAWEVQAGLITVVGEAEITPCSVMGCLNGTEPIEGAMRQGDPLADLPAPPLATPSNPVSTAGGVNPIADGPPCNQTYYPGRYHNELSINSNAVACLAPGLYQLDAGFHANGGGQVYGTGVFFYVVGGGIDLNGNGRIVLEPVSNAVPTTDPLYAWRGISFFQSRTNTSEASISGNNSSRMGTVYLPGAHIDFQGSASANGTDFITGQAIGNTVTVTGNGYLSIDAEEPDQAIPPQPDMGLHR
jgi:hypothetical protein